jgi:hypothetical protein
MRAMDVAQHLSNLILKLWQSSSLKNKTKIIEKIISLRKKLF